MTSLTDKQARITLLFLGWNWADETGASKRRVFKRADRPSPEFLRRKDGLLRTERSHMIAVLSNEAVRRYRLLRDQLDPQDCTLATRLTIR